MDFSKTRKLEIRKKYYEVLKSYSNYNFVTDDLLLYLSKEEIDWKRHANETVIDVSNVEKVIPMKYLTGDCYDYVCCYWALHYPRPNAEKCSDYSKEDYNPEEEK